jgi:hypothetical protein
MCGKKSMNIHCVWQLLFQFLVISRIYILYKSLSISTEDGSWRFCIFIVWLIYPVFDWLIYPVIDWLIYPVIDWHQKVIMHLYIMILPIWKYTQVLYKVSKQMTFWKPVPIIRKCTSCPNLIFSVMASLHSPCLVIERQFIYM